MAPHTNKTDSYNANTSKVSASKKMFQCKECGNKFTLFASLQMHYSRHAGYKRFKCDLCGNWFLAKGDLTRHIKSHSGIQDYHCTLCGRKYTRNYFLQQHIKRIHPHLKKSHQITCKNCGDVYDTENFDDHTCSGSLDDCNSVYINAKELKTHSETLAVLPLKPEKVPCKECQKMFHPDSLRRHSRIHSGEKPYMCLRCLTLFCDPSSIRQHMRFHVKKKQVFCRNCQSIFDSPKELKSHVQKEHDGQNFYRIYDSKEIDQIRKKGKTQNLVKPNTKKRKFRKKDVPSIKTNECVIEKRAVNDACTNRINLDVLLKEEGDDNVDCEVVVKDEPLIMDSVSEKVEVNDDCTNRIYFDCTNRIDFDVHLNEADDDNVDCEVVVKDEPLTMDSVSKKVEVKDACNNRIQFDVRIKEEDYDNVDSEVVVRDEPLTVDSVSEKVEVKDACNKRINFDVCIKEEDYDNVDCDVVVKDEPLDFYHKISSSFNGGEETYVDDN